MTIATLNMQSTEDSTSLYGQIRADSTMNTCVAYIATLLGPNSPDSHALALASAVSLACLINPGGASPLGM